MLLLTLRKKLSTTLVKHSTPLLTLLRKLPAKLLTRLLLLLTTQALSSKAQWMTLLLLSTKLLKQPKKRQTNRLWLTAT